MLQQKTVTFCVIITLFQLSSTELYSKPGQCPYLIPQNVVSCDYTCETDRDCNGSMKCCANGCGTDCVEPLNRTVCQHLKAILIHNAHEVGIPAKDIYIPQCRRNDGKFESVQCNSRGQCWCVDNIEENGISDGEPCLNSVLCEQDYNCTKHCEHGYILNSEGCHHCVCKDLCEELNCHEEHETCKFTEVSCNNPPCSRIPTCVPRNENPCKFGVQLLVDNETVHCGPSIGKCPSSHICQLNPLVDVSYCCPKPKEVCHLQKDEGPCNNSASRWYFNAESNRCEQFTYGGCKGNQNNFESEKICKKVCRVLSNCEQVRERNLMQAEKYKKDVFIPECDPETGNWFHIQCLDHVGICWCSDPNGKLINGTITKGVPCACH